MTERKIDFYLNNEEECLPHEQNNLIPKICELILLLPRADTQEIPLLCDLTFGESTEILAKKRYAIGISRCKLELNVEGFRINREKRFGSAQSKSDYTISMQNQQDLAKSGSLNLGLNLPNNIKLNASTGRESTIRTSFNASYNHHYVTAQSKDTWLIQSCMPTEKYLNSRIIPGVPICYLTSVSRKNMKSVTGHVLLTPFDVSFTCIEDPNAKIDHVGLIKALIIKRLRNTSGKYPEFNERTTIVTLSNASIGDQIDE